MKKRIASILAVIMLATSFTAGLFGCGDNKGGNNNTNSGDNTTDNGGNTTTDGGDNNTSGGDNNTDGGDNTTNGGDNNTDSGNGDNGGNGEQTPATLTSSTKPVMPTDSDLQTVEAADVMNEIYAYINDLYNSENGILQSYSISDEKMQYTGEFAELEDGEPNGITELATGTSRDIYEIASAYCGIKSEDSVKAAYSICTDSLSELVMDSTNPKLDYLDRYIKSRTNYAGIQNDSKMYAFIDGEYENILTESYAAPEELKYYAEDSDMFQSLDNYSDSVVSCMYAIDRATYSGICSYGIMAVTRGIKISCDYVKSDYTVLSLFPEGDYYGESDVRDFELIAKKSQTKLYVSTKFWLDYKDYDRTAEIENILLIDLNQPQTMDSLASKGKDLSRLELSEMATQFVYPDLTSEQLTTAVKEGTSITVDIKGDGDVANLKVYDVKGEELSIVDGKITIDGAAIKESIDNGKTVDKNGDVVYTVNRNITFEYMDDLLPLFYVDIYIDFDEIG